MRTPASSVGPRYPRSLGTLKAPPVAREIVARLERAGHEAWCVGGAVRDALLGHPHLDWDFATSATPTEIMRVFKRTVPVGIAFGTVGVLDADDVMHEVTTFRRDVVTDGRHALVAFGVSLEDDLARRDFTINAIAFHPTREELRDPFDGQLDLRRGVVRAVGTPRERLEEDYLRALRALRFAARLGFHIHPDTWSAIKDAAPKLSQLSAERVHQELEKTMQQVEHPSIAFGWWRTSGALGVLVPAIADAAVVRFEALDHLPQGSITPEGRGATLNRLAMLFFGSAPAEVQRSCRALRFSNADESWITALTVARTELGASMDDALEAGTPAPPMIRQWVSRVGRTRMVSFLALTTALWSAKLARRPDAALRARLRVMAQQASHAAWHDPIEVADLAVDGDDLRREGITAGPVLGKVLRELLALVVAEPELNQRDALLLRARDLAASIPR